MKKKYQGHVKGPLFLTLFDGKQLLMEMLKMLKIKCVDATIHHLCHKIDFTLASKKKKIWRHFFLSEKMKDSIMNIT